MVQKCKNFYIISVHLKNSFFAKKSHIMTLLSLVYLGTLFFYFYFMWVFDSKLFDMFQIILLSLFYFAVSIFISDNFKFSNDKFIFLLQKFVSYSLNFSLIVLVGLMLYLVGVNLSVLVSLFCDSEAAEDSDDEAVESSKNTEKSPKGKDVVQVTENTQNYTVEFNKNIVDNALEKGHFPYNFLNKERLNMNIQSMIYKYITKLIVTTVLPLFNKLTPLNFIDRVLAFNSNLRCFIDNVLSIGRCSVAKTLTLATGFGYYLHQLITDFRNQHLKAINSQGFFMFSCCLCYCATCGDLSAEPVSSADRIADWLNAVDAARGVEVSEAVKYTRRVMALEAFLDREFGPFDGSVDINASLLIISSFQAFNFQLNDFFQRLVILIQKFKIIFCSVAVVFLITPTPGAKVSKIFKLLLQVILCRCNYGCCISFITFRVKQRAPPQCYQKWKRWNILA